MNARIVAVSPRTIYGETVGLIYSFDIRPISEWICRFSDEVDGRFSGMRPGDWANLTDEELRECKASDTTK